MLQTFTFRRIALALAAVLIAGTGYSGEEAPQAGTQPGTVAIPSDPFSEVLKNLPTEKLSAGSSCVLLKIPLPEGYSEQDINLNPR